MIIETSGRADLPKAMLRALIALLALSTTASAQSPAAKPTRVDRYGSPLPEGARERLGSVAFRRAGAVHQLHLSPAGDRLLVGARGATRELWDPKLGARLGTLTSKGSSWEQLLFSPDGRTLFSAGRRDGAVEVWDLTTLQRTQVLRLPRTDRAVNGLFLTRKGELLTTTYDELRWWNLKTGKQTRFVVTEELIHRPVFSSDGAWIASSGSGGTLNVFDSVRGDVVREIAWSKKTKRSPTIYQLAFSPNSKLLAAVGGRFKAAELHLYDVKSGKRLVRAKADSYRVEFAPDGKHLITIDDSEAIQVWDLKGNKTIRIATGGYTGDFAVSAKRLAVGVGAAIGTLTWPPAAGQALRTAKGHTSFSSLAITPDGKRVLSTGGGELREWSLADGALLRKQALPRPGTIAVSPDGASLAVAQGGGIVIGKGNKKSEVAIYDARTWKRKASLPKDGWLHFDIRFSPDGKLLALGGRSSARLIDTATWKEVGQLKGSNWALAFSPDSKALAVGNYKKLMVWDVTTRKLLRSFPHPQIFGLSYSPDGKQLAFSSLRPRAIRLIGQPKGDTIHDLSGFFRINASPEPVFSPDGKLLVFGFSDKAEQITLVDVASGKPKHVFKTPGEGYMVAAAFSPDGKTLVTGMQSGTILVWSIDVQPLPRTKALESPFRE